MERLHRTYFGLFRECPPLLPLAFTAGATQFAFALLNIYAFPFYLSRHWGLSGLEIGIVATTFLMFEALLKAPMGHISDRLTRKPFIVLGPLLVSLNPVIATLLPARLWLLVLPLRAVDGAGAAALWPPLYALVGDITRRASRAAAMSIINTMYMGSYFVAVGTGAVLVSLTHNYRVLFYLASGLLLAGGLVGQLSLPAVCEVVEEGEEGAEGEAAPGEETPAARPRMPYSFPLILLLSFLMYFGALMPASFTMLFVGDDLKLSLVRLWPLALVLGIPAVALGVPLGHVADRLGKSLSVRMFLAVAAVAMWCMAVLFALVARHLAHAGGDPSAFVVWAFTGQHYLVLIGAIGIFLVLGLVFGIPAWMALVSTLAPSTSRGVVMGAVATAEGLGAAIGPVFGGLLWDVRHSYIFYGSAAALTAAALTALYALRRKREA